VGISFAEGLLLFGGLLAVVAALSGVMKGTVLSASVLSVALGFGLAAAGVVDVEATDEAVVELVELALILTLFSDGMFVERELLRSHWGPTARALVIAMPITMGLLALAAKALFPDLGWAEAFLLGAVLSPTDPVVTSAVVTSRLVPSKVRHTLNLESGLNDGLALPFVLFFLVLATPGGSPGGEAAKLVGEALLHLAHLIEGNIGRGACGRGDDAGILQWQEAFWNHNIEPDGRGQRKARQYQHHRAVLQAPFEACAIAADNALKQPFETEPALLCPVPLRDAVAGAAQKMATHHRRQSQGDNG